MYRQKMLPLLVACGASIATFIGVIYLSNLTYTFSTFDLPLGIVTSLACLSLIGPFWTGKPRIMLRGLYAYVWFLGLAFCYLQNGNMRVFWYGLPLPDYSKSLYGFLVSFIVTCILVTSHKYIIRLLSHILNPSDKKISDRSSEIIYPAYQQGYQSSEEPKQQETFTQHSVPGYEKYERPQALYPQEFPEQQKM